MESERSSRKKTFTPSIGFFHCKPAMASTTSSVTTTRSETAVQRRHDVICTSVFHASHATQAQASGRSRSQCGWVN